MQYGELRLASRLGLDPCVPHRCHCGTLVDAHGCTASSARAAGRTARHHAQNDLIARGFASAGFTVTKDPTGLFRSDKKRPDGLTLVPWQSGRVVCWNVTVICPLAESLYQWSSPWGRFSGRAAASRKEEKCITFSNQLRSRLWAFSAHLPVSSCFCLVGLLRS